MGFVAFVDAMDKSHRTTRCGSNAPAGMDRGPGNVSALPRLFPATEFHDTDQIPQPPVGDRHLRESVERDVRAMSADSLDNVTPGCQVLRDIATALSQQDSRSSRDMERTWLVLLDRNYNNARDARSSRRAHPRAGGARGGEPGPAHTSGPR